MFAGWDNGYTLALLLAAVVIGSVAAVRGRRLRLAATVAFLALIVVDAVALVIAFLTYPWE
jgi:DMSO reductase anchor subunit